MLRQLSRHCRLHLLAFHHADELPAGPMYSRSITELRQFCDYVEYIPLWVKRSRLHRRLGLIAATLYPKPYSVLAHRSARLAHRISDICSGPTPPDLVHLDTIALAPYARYCGGIPVVLAHHNVESQLMSRRAAAEKATAARWYVTTQARRLRRYEQEQCGRFSLNITVSSDDARTLREFVPGIRTAVIPNGVDITYFRPSLPCAKPILVFVGSMSMFANREGVEWFIDSVWALIKRQVPEVRFLVVGGHPGAAIYAAAKVDPSIEVLGYVPDVRPWLDRASVYVVPLRVGGGTKLKVLDAMAQGKAIVSTSIGAEGIAITHGEHLLLADTPRDFAGSVVELLRSSERRVRLGTAARLLAERSYSWPRLCDKLVAEYRSLLTNATSTPMER
jgi:polysaccharide biosynthesis protein PslH